MAETKKPETKSGDGPYYAWNTFAVEWDETTGLVTEKIMPGEPITQSDLDVSDEEWESLIETGAVSEDEYPDLPPSISPAEYEAEMATHEAMVSVVEVHQEAMDAALASDVPAPHAVDSNVGGEPFVDPADVQPEKAATPPSKAASTTSKS